MASITVSSDGAEQKYALENPAVTLGRGLESDIRLKDIKASRRHCQIVKTPQGYQCLDLSSGNGTFINGVQIKQQLLSEGDRIQIGSTTITFHDANGAAAGPAKPKAAPAAAPATGRAGAPKPATAVLPAAPTKKITAKIDVVKPPSQAVPKPSTQNISKMGTQPLGKPATTAVKKTTQRMGQTTRATGKVSATQKFHAEGRRKKVSPVTVLIGLIVVVFLVVVALILFVGGDDTELKKAQLAKLTGDAAMLDSKNDLEGALKKYKEALELVRSISSFKTNVVQLKGNIEELEGRMKALAGANAQFQEFDAKFQKATDEDAYKLWQEGKALYGQYEGANVSFLPKLKEELEKLDNMSRSKRAAEKKMEFQTARQEIADQCKLATVRVALFGDAIKRWKEYIDKKPPEDARQKAEGEIVNINRRATEEASRIRREVDRAIEDKRQAGALETLGKEAARFEGTASFDEVKKQLARLEQK